MDERPRSRRGRLRRAVVTAAGVLFFFAGTATVRAGLTIYASNTTYSQPVQGYTTLFVDFYGLRVLTIYYATPDVIDDRLAWVTRVVIAASLVVGLLQGALMSWVADRLYGAFARPTDAGEES